MARGITIGDVENKVQHISDNNVIPLSTGADVPEVVTVGVLKEHINEDVETALEGKQDVISDLAAIRSGAALGATAVQVESDPTVPSWAKQPSKPSYSYSEITGKPTLSTVATSGSYNDLTNKPTIPTVPTNVSAFTNDAGYLTEHQDISGKANSNDLATVAFSGDYEDLENTPTIPDVPVWAMSSTKPSYTVSEIDGAQEELVSGTNIKTINNESILGSGNITIQGGGGGGDVNVIESITFNGSAVPVDASKNAAITYSAPVTSVNGNTGAVSISVPSKISDLIDDSDFISTSSTSGLVKNDGSIDTSTYLTSSALSGYVQTSSTSGLIKNDGTIDTSSYITSSSLSNYVEKSQTAGLLKNDGTVDTNTYLTSETEPDFNGSAAAGITSSDITAWNGKQNALVFNTAYDASSNKVATMSDIPDISTKQDVIDSSNKLSADLITDGTTNKVINVKPDWNAASGNDAEILNKPTIPSEVTESTVSGWGFTKNAGTITGITMNSASKGTSGVVDLGTVITSHQDISGKEDTSNKVTSLSASSTDTEYPSAKCVWDLVGDIETILASI